MHRFWRRYLPWAYLAAAALGVIMLIVEPFR